MRVVGDRPRPARRLFCDFVMVVTWTWRRPSANRPPIRALITSLEGARLSAKWNFLSAKWNFAF